MAYSGFPASTLKLVRGLERNNTKAWFEKNRALYDEGYVEAGKAFVSAVEPKLHKIAPEVECQPKINGSIFRINRDVRFSKDKRPYKPHVDFWFWEGARKGAVSGFFFRVAPKEVIVGVGAHGFAKEQLAAFRSAVSDPASGKALAALAKKLTKAGYTLEGESYKRTPKGFDDEGPAAAFLRFGALHASVKLPVKVASSGAVLTEAMKHWRKLSPLHAWLVEHVQRA